MPPPLSSGGAEIQNLIDGYTATRNIKEHHDAEESSTEIPRVPAEGTTSEKHVLHPFGSRVLNGSSPLVQQLLSVGFKVDAESRQLVVGCEKLFDTFVEHLRADWQHIPKEWGMTTLRPFRKILSRYPSSSPSEAVRLHQKQQKNLQLTSAFVASIDCSNAESGLVPDVDAHVILNRDQNAVLNLVFEGRNLYLGGSAGTGKSVLLRRIRRELMLRGLSVAMTATTGIAACQIGGTTFHSALRFSHTGEFVGDAEELLKFDVIVIDEVSMLSAALLESLDYVLRRANGTAMPFGGIQLILSGDFLQLGPVKESNILKSPLFHNHFVHVQLQQQVRQDAASNFYTQLQTMRKGSCPDDLETTVVQHAPGTLMNSAVNLLPTNAEVKRANDEELKNLPGALMSYTPLVLSPSLVVPVTSTVLLKTDASFSPSSFAAYFTDAMRHAQGVSGSGRDVHHGCISLYRVFEDCFALRVVLPTESVIASPANGAESPAAAHSATEDAAKIVTERFHAAVSRIDEKVGAAYGCRVYEILADGNNFCTEPVENVLRKLVEKHAVIQPLTLKIGSRVLLRANLTPTLVNGSIGIIKEFVPASLETMHKLVRDQVETILPAYDEYCKQELLMQQTLLPLVEFSNGETLIIPPWKYLVGGSAETDYYGLNTICLPLSLAYAFTVHKVQGLTLYGKVHLELSRMWNCPHLLYVAMSRVKNPDQLSMSGFKREMIVADSKCVEFESKLPSVHEARRPPAAHVSMWHRAEVGRKLMVEVLRGATKKHRCGTTGILQTTNTLTMKKNHLDEALSHEHDAVALVTSQAAAPAKSGQGSSIR